MRLWDFSFENESFLSLVPMLQNLKIYPVLRFENPFISMEPNSNKRFFKTLRCFPKNIYTIQ